MGSIPLNNNFNGLRLVAALLVFFFHLVMFKVIAKDSAAGQFILGVFGVFPGVAIFFLISGFLVTNSLLKQPALKDYLKARALRIYPALWVAVALSVLLLVAFDFWNQVSTYKAIRWVFTQSTGYFVYRMPKAFEELTGGMVNANLWTLPIEIAFYVTLPLFLIKHKTRPILTSLFIIAVMLISLILVIFDAFGQHRKPDLRLGMFYNYWWLGCGVLVRLHWDQLKRFLEGKAHWWLTAHFFVVFLVGTDLPWKSANASIFLSFTLAPLIFSCAFSLRNLSHSIIGDLDISYGLYLLHPLAIHFATRMGVVGLDALVPVVMLSLSGALLSWLVVEEPILRKYRLTRGSAKSYQLRTAQIENT